MPRRTLAPSFRRALLAAVAFVLPLFATSAEAQAPASASASATTEARALFRAGKELHDAGDVERALDFFRRSNAVLPSKGASLNIANSLDLLGRLDEAYEAYEDAVAGFGGKFDPDDKATIPLKMRELEGKLGAVFVSADAAGGAVVIDGRDRGKLPLSRALRLMPGSHTVRVMKDGFRTFEEQLTVKVGETVKVDARLEPLAFSGGLRIEVPALVGADILVDGVKVGVAPWEGTLAPGPHVVTTRKGDRGSAPTLATVLQGQIVLVRLTAAQLGGRRRVTVHPPTATLRLGDAPLGKGEWSGDLPEGAHAFTASEEGYFSETRTVTIGADGGAETVAITLRVDRDHPKWPKEPTGTLRWELFAMYGVGSSLHSGASKSCCGSSGLAAGPVAGAVVGYELPSGLSVEGAAGGLSFAQRTSRDVPRAGDRSITYRLDDLVRVKGWWLGAGVGQRVALGGRWSFRSRLLVGLMFARSSDTIEGVAANAAGAETRASVDGSGAQVSTTPVFVSPSVGVAAAVGAWSIGGSLAAWTILSSGAGLSNDLLRVSPSCAPGAPCPGDSTQLRGESSHGPFIVYGPQVSLSRAF